MKFLVITIDTEIDKSPNWNVSGDQTFHSVLNGIPNKLVPLFNNFGSKPTYLLSSEVIENKDCVNVLKDIRNCELGTHLHGDLVDPQKRIKNMANQNTSELQSSYSQEIEFEKLKNLTDLFINKFGHRPTSFRDGRFGAGNNTISALENLGYLVDSSVTPGVNWDLLEGKINYLDAKCQPYFPSRLEILREGESTVLEVPISIVSPSIRRLFYVREKIMGGIPLT